MVLAFSLIRIRLDRTNTEHGNHAAPHHTLLRHAEVPVRTPQPTHPLSLELSLVHVYRLHAHPIFQHPLHESGSFHEPIDRTHPEFADPWFGVCRKNASLERSERGRPAGGCDFPYQAMPSCARPPQDPSIAPGSKTKALSNQKKTHAPRRPEHRKSHKRLMPTDTPTSVNTTGSCPQATCNM